MQQTPVSEHEISVEEVEAAIVLTTRRSVGTAEIGPTIGEVFREIYAYLGQAGAMPAGPPFVIYHAQSGGGSWDIEICAPVTTALPAPAGYECRTVAGGQMVKLLHQGPYESLAGAYDSIVHWATDRGLALGASMREIYLSEPGTPPEAIETLIRWPLATADTSTP